MCMATALWVRTIRHHRIDKQVVEPCSRNQPQEALEAALHKLDIAIPIWLEKNQKEWEDFGQTRFLPDAFLESVPFERLEIEYIDPDVDIVFKRKYRKKGFS